MRRKFQWFETSPERISTVIDEITTGSQPSVSFYLLLVISSMIASFGLLADNSTVIIGAMLVSPLMT